MAKKLDRRGIPKGTPGGQMPAHKHNDLAAKLIRELRSYGLPQRRVSDHLNWLQDEKILDLGKQGYSIDTLQRHYRLSLDLGAMPNKHMLMQIVAQGAMAEDLPDNISPDLAYRLAFENARWMLEKVYGVGNENARGSRGSQEIPIELIGEVLTVDEIGQLESIMAKLQRAMDPSKAIVDGTATNSAE